jgi:hypothetical protein
VGVDIGFVCGGCCNTIGDIIDEYGIKPINAELIIE